VDAAAIARACQAYNKLPGSESPRDLFVTDALSSVLPDARIEELPGQAHEGMTTAPEIYVAAVTTFLLGSRSSDRRSAS
jgi:hypothetical protein